MSATQKSATWQPTYWDHLFYRWIKFEGKSQTWVANNFPVSQPTISRMLCRYERWQARTAPREKGQLDHEERLRAQRWLTYERNEVILHSCLRVAEKLEGFTDVSRTVERSKEYSRQVKDTTTTMAVMDRTGTMARFLRLAFRVNMEQFKLSQLDPLPPLEPLSADEVAELDAQDSAALVEWTNLLHRLDKQPAPAPAAEVPANDDTADVARAPPTSPADNVEDGEQQPEAEDQKPTAGIPFNLNLTPELHPDFEYWRAQQAAEDAELDRQFAAGHFAAEVADVLPAPFAAMGDRQEATDAAVTPTAEPPAPTPAAATPVNDGRVEEWRGDEGYGLLPFQGFPVCGAISACHAPFPLPARRTGQAVFPHPALGQGSGGYSFGFTLRHTKVLLYRGFLRGSVQRLSRRLGEFGW